MSLEEKIVNWLREQVGKSPAKGIVVGMSGGVDSSVVAVLAKKAFPDNVLGIAMPCFSGEIDKEYALLTAKKFNIPVKIVPLSTVFMDLYSRIEGRSYNEGETSVAISNMKPRLRMISLYYFANKFNYLVAGTGNKSELTMGYFTKYGDGGVDILPIAGLLKTEVWQLAKEIGVPQEIIKRTPTAGLWVGQTDEREMGITYKELDRVIVAMEKGKTRESDEKIVKMIKQRTKKHSHKVNLPPIFKDI